MNRLSFESAISTHNIRQVVDRKKGEWLKAERGVLRPVHTTWEKAWFVFCNLATFGASLKATAKLIDEAYKKAIRAALNDPSFVLDSNNDKYMRLKPTLKALVHALKRTHTSLYSPKTLQKIKELASYPELVESRAAMKQGILPQSLNEGISGSYVLYSRRKEKLGIFKPREQEAGAIDNPKGFAKMSGLFGVVPGTSYLREKAAYLLDRKDHFCGVPKTQTAVLKSKYFTKSLKTKKNLTGSFQKWIDNSHQAFDDYQILPRFLSAAKGHLIPKEEIHKIAIFDIRMLNCDRHLKNFLVDKEWNIHPIDHGYILPGNAASIRFDWINFSQAKEPFSEETLRYITRLNPAADIALIKKKIPDISESALKMVEISTLLLQIAAIKGLTAYQIADLMMRRSHEGIASLINFFIPVPCKDPSYFETHIWQTLKAHPHVNKHQFLTNEVNKYLLTFHGLDKALSFF
jgi:hypothetical protein